MPQPCAPSQSLPQISSESSSQTELSVQQLRSKNAELHQYLDAQKRVIGSLERRAGQSLESLGVHMDKLSTSLHTSAAWQLSLVAVQNEVDRLCDLLSDAMLVQKLEAGKVEVKLEEIAPNVLFDSVTRHLLVPDSQYSGRLVCTFDDNLPSISADQDMTEAVLVDLLARGLKYSDSDAPVMLSATQVEEGLQICVTAQRFAPVGDRNFATEIVLCCRRIEVQNGKICCQQTPQGAQSVVITLAIA
jgi:signal transduction histidine kinase